MNQLAVLNKHLRLAGEANAKITGVESRKKANFAIMQFCVGMQGVVAEAVGLPAETVVLAVPEAVAGVNQGGEALPASLRDEVVGGVSVPVETYKGNPVLEPITDHNWEVGEAGPGVMGEVVTTEPPAEIPPVEMIGGWPVEAMLTVSGLAPNRRHLRGSLPDGKIVTIERTFGRAWKGGEVVKCRLIRAGGAPLFRVT